jgi:hypothetical protein
LITPVGSGGDHVAAHSNFGLPRQQLHL